MSEQIRRDEPNTTPKQARENQEHEVLNDLPAERVQKDEQVKGGRTETPEL